MEAGPLLLVKSVIIFANKYGRGCCQKYRLTRIQEIQLTFAGREEAEAKRDVEAGSENNRTSHSWAWCRRRCHLQLQAILDCITFRLPSSNWILFRDETKKEEVKEVEEVKPALDKTCVFEGLNEDKLKEGDDEDKVEVKANKEDKKEEVGKETAVDRTGDISESAQDKVEDLKVASSKILEVVKEKVEKLKGKQEDKVEENQEKVEELGSEKGKKKEGEEKVPGAEKGTGAAD